MNEYYTIKETDTVWTIDCQPNDVSKVMEAAKAIFDEPTVKHVTIYWNWTDPERDEDMIDIIWYDGKDKRS